MKRTFTLVFIALVAWEVRSQVIINELMQSNIDCIMDDQNEFPDSWVELYNAGNTSVNLQSYSIGTAKNGSDAYTLPSTTIAPHGFALVYCDKEGHDMHTPWRLESGKGCNVYLFHQGSIVDQVENLKKQPAPNIAYGRESNGSDIWGYMLTPTPKTSNTGGISDKMLGTPIFNEPGRVLTSYQYLSVALSVPGGSPEGTQIRYTTNGSEPTISSTLYTSPIAVNNSRTIRAKLFCEGWLSPRSTTQSYLYLNREMTLPVISIVTDDRYFNDNQIGIYVDGTYESGKKNYEFDWRRPINIEYFEEPGNESELNQLCETRIQGGATRSNKMKSLAIYAHKRFGTKRFAYEFFPDQRPGDTEFKSLVLRNAGNDFDYLFMRDAIIQRSMAEHVDLDWQAWRPAIIFINGTYKGMLNIRERSNEDNIYTHYDGLEDLDMIENWWDLKEGDWENWNAFQAFYAEHGHTLAEYAQWIDWEEFINLMAMNLYFNNQDFPGNNIVMWRPRTADGRWRFIAKDTDFGLGLYGSSPDYNSIEWLHNPDYDWNRNWANKYEHTRLFRRMMEDTDFAREFLDRCAIYMGDFLNEQGVRAVWDPMYNLVKTEYPHHRKLINEWWPNYNDELNNARNWLSKRTSYFYTQLANYYHLGTPTILKVNTLLSEEERGSIGVTFNGIKLSKSRFDGRFFANRSITLSGIPSEGKQVVGWQVRQTNSNGQTTTQEISGSTYTFMMPSCNYLVINAVLADVDGIEEVSHRTWRWQTNGEELTVSGVERGVRVSVFDANGILLLSQVSDGHEMVLPMSKSGLSVLRVGDEAVKVRK